MQKTQIVCIGASTTYGVGGSKGGWPDLLKSELHQLMYGEDNLGELCEIYSIGVPGAVISDMVDRTELLLKTIRKPNRKMVSILQGGSNNAKAVDSPDNFISTPEEYRQELSHFLQLIKRNSDEAICMGLFPMDQEKVMPKVSAIDGKKVYFPNERIALFEKVLQEVVGELKIEFVPMFEKAVTINWTQDYQYVDGIHPNDNGHQWLYDQIKPSVWKYLDLQ
jgi:lysophospholipase L1-like esterase